MKLGNFLAIDPNDPRNGLPGFGKLDKIVFYEFTNNREELMSIAHTIEQSLSDSKTFEQLAIASIEEDFEEINVKEGKVIFRLHKLRERNPALIKKKKSLILQRTGKLVCEVCNFDFQSVYGKLGEGFIECHHTKPISQMKIDDITRLEDLALVCSNCHRMLHRNNNISLISLRSFLKEANVPP